MKFTLYCLENLWYSIFRYSWIHLSQGSSNAIADSKVFKRFLFIPDNIFDFDFAQIRNMLSNDLSDYTKNISTFRR